jgi:3',5'-cyclic AMP phosphodiesterase CpdA
MSLLLHVSDPHFGTELPHVLSDLRALALAQRPQLVVLSGDITQRARRAQFDAARRFVDALDVPVLAIPGNHDVPLFNLPARLLAPYGGYARCFGPVAPVHADDRWLVIGVNTTRWWRHKHGELSARQVQRVAQRLREAGAGQLRVVVIHQPLQVLDPGDRHDCVRVRGSTRDDVVRTWSAAGADLVLSGHIHRSFIVQPASDGRRLWCVQAGTAVSRRLRHGEPNEVNLIRWRDGECVVEQWEHRGPAGFVPARRAAFQPAR